jgi:YXWGXW repeat-containing protein
MRFYASIRNLLFLALVMLAIPAAAHAQIGVSVAIAPPELPVYEQPVCPGDDYIWTPGYWAYADDYYWVPGTWVLAPEVGFLWTPPYWGWGGSGFIFYDGYWGPHIGFYGGINYGFGYFGHGFEGGRWDNGHFFYNRAVMNVGGNIRNVYNTRVDVRTDTHVSFNGGRGGIDAHASAEEEAAARDRHVGPVAAQEQHREAARSDPQQRFATNHGRPAVAATPRAGDFKASGAVAARDNGAARSTTVPGHVKDLPPAERPAPVKTGNAKTDQKYQQQQEKLNAKQDQERQKVQQKQEQEHQQMDRQKASDTQRQQTEQRHQQQTQQLVQRHTQQQQQLQQHQQSAARPSGGGKPK